MTDVIDLLRQEHCNMESLLRDIEPTLRRRDGRADIRYGFESCLRLAAVKRFDLLRASSKKSQLLQKPFSFLRAIAIP
jgi:hypothetical protein